MPSTLVLVYDGESPGCRRLADWVARRDREGLIVPFPAQNGEVARVAPELAGKVGPGVLLVLDSGTRKVSDGAGATREMLKRLPGWSLVAALGAAPLVHRFLVRTR